jgi:ADP-heptose:LPS heptosyltransferase
MRSIPLSHFSGLAALPGVHLISLQKGIGRNQLKDLGPGCNIVDLAPELDNGTEAFEDTAAVMKNLDLVISSDTSVAHLAGGLGIPVWVALGFIPEWRWLLHREDSPWYPTMRLFRQPAMFDWQSVFKSIEQALWDLVLKSREEASPAGR